jgi:hypothetical protein
MKTRNAPLALAALLPFFSVRLSAQEPSALAQLAAAGGGPLPAAPPSAPSQPVPAGGFETQNKAWDELVRPLAAFSARLDAIDREFDSTSRSLLASSAPGLSMWGKDIADRTALKGRINIAVDDLRAEQRIREGAYAIAWRLYGNGELSRLDEQGRTLAAAHLRRLTAPEKRLDALVEKLRSFRSGQSGLIARGVDGAISSGLDSMLAADAQIRRYADATRRLLPPAPAPR